jgi:AcrR family transcriptional regulator
MMPPVPVGSPAGSPRRRGRPALISREQIVDAALEVGIKDLTMSAVAERLGSTPQAFYRWVTDRDELIALVADALVERVEAPPDNGRPWREWLAELASNIRDVLQQAPGLAVHSITAYRTSLPFLRLNERACQVLTAAGFSLVEAQRTYLTFGSVLLGWQAREETLLETADHMAADLKRTLEQTDEHFPLIEAVVTPALHEPPEARWEHFLTTLLNGLPGPRNR